MTLNSTNQHLMRHMTSFCHVLKTLIFGTQHLTPVNIYRYKYLAKLVSLRIIIRSAEYILSSICFKFPRNQACVTSSCLNQQLAYIDIISRLSPILATETNYYFNMLTKLTLAVFT